MGKLSVPPNSIAGLRGDVSRREKERNG